MGMQKQKLLLALLLQLCFTMGLGSGVACVKTSDRAPAGLIAWGQDFSGWSRAQILAHLKKEIPSSVSYEEKSYPLKLERSYANIEQWVDQAFPNTTGHRYTDLLNDLRRPFIVISPKPLKLDKEEIMTQLLAISKNINLPMCPATVTYSEGKLIKTAGEAGQELDSERSWLNIASDHKSQQVPLVVNKVPAQPDTADISEIKDIIGDYTTYFDPQDITRTKNLQLAAHALDNQLIPPDQVFSFNNVVGERTEAAGYLPAFIFADCSVVLGDGGGVCQDSSTLFQAVRQAHLGIIEKHTHSLPVSYVLKGEDATVSYGTFDFRFRNDTRGYLLISARTGSNWLRVQLFGLADDQHPVVQRPGGYPYHPNDFYKDPD